MKNKDAVLLIRKEILKSSNLDFETILKLPELKRYYLGLKYVTTSNNAICKALNVPIEVKRGHLNVLKEIEIPLHTLNPKSGLNEIRLRPRYSISIGSEF